MADFPPRGMPKEHSKYHRITPIDPNIRAEMEGGYIITRARNNREPRRQIRTGYELLYDNEKLVLESFQNGRKITGLTFTYALPTTGEIVVVRFEQPISFEYIGMGPTKLWRVENILMREA